MLKQLPNTCSNLSKKQRNCCCNNISYLCIIDYPQRFLFDTCPRSNSEKDEYFVGRYFIASRCPFSLYFKTLGIILFTGSRIGTGNNKHFNFNAKCKYIHDDVVLLNDVKIHVLYQINKDVNQLDFDKLILALNFINQRICLCPILCIKLNRTCKKYDSGSGRIFYNPSIDTSKVSCRKGPICHT